MPQPEDRARDSIDRRLAQAGWLLQDMAQLDPSAGRGVAVREYPTTVARRTTCCWWTANRWA